MFGPSLPLGRIANIPIRVHWTFSLLLLFIGVSYFFASGTLAGAASGIVFILAIFGCVLLHELGHSLAARQFGIGTKHITLLPIGGVAALERMPKRWTQELWVAIAGPLVNVAICAALIPWLLITGVTPAEFLLPVSMGGSLAAHLLVANAVLVVFNLLPIFPMDGGRVLRAFLASTGDHRWATNVAARIGQGAAVLLGILGLFYAPLLLVLAIFVIFAAEGERRAVSLRSDLEGLRVADVMRSNVKTVYPTETVAGIAELLIESGQHGFPVSERGVVLAMLDRKATLDALASGSPTQLVRDVAIRDFAFAHPDEHLTEALELLAKTEQNTLPVFVGRELVGLLEPPAIDVASALRKSNPEMRILRTSPKAVYA